MTIELMMQMIDTYAFAHGDMVHHFCDKTVQENDKWREEVEKALRELVDQSRK